MWKNSHRGRVSRRQRSPGFGTSDIYPVAEKGHGQVGAGDRSGRPQQQLSVATRESACCIGALGGSQTGIYARAHQRGNLRDQFTISARARGHLQPLNGWNIWDSRNLRQRSDR